jgi:cytochrome d ubiquinol oxidase subunit I
VWVSLLTFTLVYAALFVVWFVLMRRYVRAGPLPHDRNPYDIEPTPPGDEPRQLSFAY